LDSAVGLDRDRRRMRFQIALVTRGNLEGVFHDQVRLAKARFDVALLPSQPGKPVMKVRGEKILRRSIVITDVFMNFRRTGSHRLQRIEDGRQQFVIDLDQMQRFLGSFHGVGRHGGNAIADETYRVPAKHGHIPYLFADQAALHILTGNNRSHAGHLVCLCDIDPSNARMRVGAAQDFRPEQSWQLHISGINSPAADFAATFTARHGSADDFKIGHRVSSIGCQSCVGI
jgi:hypothetical protein